MSTFYFRTFYFYTFTPSHFHTSCSQVTKIVGVLMTPPLAHLSIPTPKQSRLGKNDLKMCRKLLTFPLQNYWGYFKNRTVKVPFPHSSISFLPSPTRFFRAVPCLALLACSRHPSLPFLFPSFLPSPLPYLPPGGAKHCQSPGEQWCAGGNTTRTIREAIKTPACIQSQQLPMLRERLSSLCPDCEEGANGKEGAKSSRLRR